MTLLLILCILPGLILDICNLPVCPLWENMLFLTSNIKFLGITVIAFRCCDYKKIELKTLLFFLCISQLIILIINQVYSERMTPVDAYVFAGLYIAWIIKLRFMREIPSTPTPDSAYYILIPINSVKGLLQAVFLPWHPARYETRMVCDGPFVWSVYRGVFRKQPISQTNISRLKGVKVPLNRRLTDKELLLLNKLDGKRVIAGLFDCRKLLVAGRV